MKYFKCKKTWTEYKNAACFFLQSILQNLVPLPPSTKDIKVFGRPEGWRARGG